MGGKVRPRERRPAPQKTPGPAKIAFFGNGYYFPGATFPPGWSIFPRDRNFSLCPQVFPRGHSLFPQGRAFIILKHWVFPRARSFSMGRIFSPGLLFFPRGRYFFFLGPDRFSWPATARGLSWARSLVETGLLRALRK